jgi:hypothetical protein
LVIKLAVSWTRYWFETRSFRKCVFLLCWGKVHTIVS